MIKDEARIRSAAGAILSIEHQMFAANLGLYEHSGELLDNQPLVTELIYSVDELSWSTDEEDRRLALQLIALTWQHSTYSLRDQIREFFILCLSRLGVAPSTRMIDPAMSETGKYDSVGSFRTKLATVAMQLHSQVLIGEIRYQLTEFQRRAFKACADNAFVGISAPTSAGKSFAIYLTIVDAALDSDKVCVYIVPTISLVNQVSEDLKERFDAHNLSDWVVSNSFEKDKIRTVFVLTQERAILAIDHGLSDQPLGLLVIDEAQNLERVSWDEETRSKILFDFLHDIRQMRFAEKIILSGPRLENIGLVGAKIFGSSFTEEHAKESPVASFTYGLEVRGKDFFFNQFENSFGKTMSLKVDNIDAAKSLLSSTYSDEYYHALIGLIDALGDGAKNLVFSPTADQARKIASRLTGFRTRPPDENPLSELSNYLSESVHPRHRLVELVQRGVAFHTGSLPPHARLAIEQAFAAGLLKDVACTTTLMQGVNLPAQNVFIRNPNLYVRKKSGSQNAELTEYEFGNLRGRAGRLLRDFVGRTVVLDQASFKQDDPQKELFGDTHKSLNLTYSEILGRNRDEIFAELERPGSASSTGAKFIATYVRQQLLRDGADAPVRMSNVGIEIPTTTLGSVARALNGLSIRREVIIENRYWDPFDLQKLSDALAAENGESLPTTAWEARTPALSSLISLVANTLPSYFERFLGSRPTDRYLAALSLSGISWAQEKPLRSILEDRKFKDDEDYEKNIDEQIDLIYRKVVYGLPALLKPVAAIQGKGAAFLASLESGAYHPITYYLMSLGLYRETAVFLKRRNFGQIKQNDPDLEALVDARVPEAMKGLDMWTRRQVEATLGRKLRGRNG